MQCTCRQTYILYTNIAESRIERDYSPRYAHAARQLISFVSAANSSVSFGFACTYVYGREGGGAIGVWSAGYYNIPVSDTASPYELYRS